MKCPACSSGVHDECSQWKCDCDVCDEREGVVQSDEMRRFSLKSVEADSY